MNKNHFTADLMAALYRACESGDAKAALEAVRAIQAQPVDAHSIHLRSLALQLKLADFFAAETHNLSLLYDGRPSLKLADGNTDQAEQYGQSIENHIEKFQDSFGECFYNAEDNYLMPIINKLKDDRLALLAMTLINTKDFHDEAWLESRATMTRDAVSESLWDAARGWSDASESQPDKNLTEHMKLMLQNDLTEAFKIAANELKLAIRGLSPKTEGLGQRI